MSDSEFPRPVDLRSITPHPVKLEAGTDECAALARRFAIPAVRCLTAEIALEAKGTQVLAAGRLRASIVQSCAVSGEDLPVEIDEPLTFRFVPEPAIDDAEIELAEEECDEIFYSGTAFDLGEAAAQSLALAIDPYLTGPNAQTVRKQVLAAQEPSGPFAALAGLKKG